MALRALRHATLATILALTPWSAAATVAQAQEPPRDEALTYSVQVAAFADAGRAEAASRTWSTPERPFYIAPVQVQGRTFYRLFAGLMSNRAEADALMASLVREGIKEDSAPWHVRETPVAFALGRYETQADAGRAIDAASAAGVSAYAVLTVDQSDGPAFTVFTGAFATLAEASLLEGQLAVAGMSAKAAIRVGVRPAAVQLALANVPQQPAGQVRQPQAGVAAGQQSPPRVEDGGRSGALAQVPEPGLRSISGTEDASGTSDPPAEAVETFPQAASELESTPASDADGFDPAAPFQPRATYDGAAFAIEVESPRALDPDIDVDGVLDEEAWRDAALLTGFTQFEPSESIPATQRTEVLMLVSNEAIHFGIRAFDDQPGGVRATLGERDTFEQSDDYVLLVLDTFKDSRQAYAIMVNPLGVQQDGLWIEGRIGRYGTRRFGPPIDWNPDFVWDSEGRVHDWGYVTELKIPFKSIRFPERKVQDWGLQVIRSISRSGFRESWAPITQSAANQLTLAGSLQNLQDLERGLFLELNPVFTGTRQGSYDPDAGALTHDPIDGEFGANLKYGITSNLTLDGTYNPDFSQVEADAGQIAVNERFALFFEEKRPFFLEGTEVFSMPKNLVYTRSIVNPVAGLKLTGKVGGFQTGYLAAVDEVGPESKRPVVNVVRVRRDLGAASNLGAVYTDRTLESNDYNRVFGVDGRLLFRQRYTLSLLAAGSRTASPDLGSETGTLLSALLERSSRNLIVTAELEDVHPDFRAGSGFIPRVGDTKVNTRIQYYFNGEPGALFERVGPGIDATLYWSHDDFWKAGGWEEVEARFGSQITLRNNITMMWAGTLSGFSKDPGAYGGLFVDDGVGGQTPFAPDQRDFEALWGVGGFLWVNSWERLRGRLRWGWKESAVFDLGLRVPVEVATGWDADLSLNTFPTRNWSAEIGLRHQSLYRKRDGSRFSIATIPRIKTQYQLNRALFLRAIFEYASQERDDLLHPVTGEPIVFCGTACTPRRGSDANDFGIETLLSYEPTPGTVFFIGYSRQLLDTGAFRFRDVTPQADGLFVKLSYRFRM